MAKATGPRKDLGVRYTCYSCGAKFYDLHRPVPTCPKCGADQREDPALKAPKPPERPARKKAAPKPVRPRNEEEDELETEQSGDDDEIELDDLDEEESSDDDLDDDNGDDEDLD